MNQYDEQGHLVARLRRVADADIESAIAKHYGTHPGCSKKLTVALGLLDLMTSHLDPARRPRAHLSLNKSGKHYCGDDSCRFSGDDNWWHVSITGTTDGESWNQHGTAMTLPLAICRAALHFREDDDV